MNIKKNFCISHIIQEGDKIWFLADPFNYLFRMDLQTMVIDFARRVPIEAPIITEKYINYMYRMNDSIYLLLNGISGVVEYQIPNDKMVYSHIPLLQGEWGSGKTEDDYFVYLPKRYENEIVRINKADYQSDTICVPNQKFGYSALCMNGYKMVLIQNQTGNLIIWDTQTNEVDVIKTKPANYYIKDNGKNYIARCVFETDSGFVVFPNQCNMIYRINGGEAEIVEVYDEVKNTENAVFSCVAIVGQQFLAFRTIDSCWVFYDRMMGFIRKEQLCFTDDVENALLADDLIILNNQGSSVLKEKEYFCTLNGFIKGVIHL